MGGTGPTPKAGERARRNATIAFTKLPAGGREGKTPRWPLPPNLRLSSGLRAAMDRKGRLEAQAELDTTPALERQITVLEERIALLEDQIKASARAERTMWRELWTTPQAAEWERLGWMRTVAQFARWQVLGELGDMDASKEARQIADRLGLTPLAMLRLRWTIEQEDPGHGAGSARRGPTAPSGARSRYRHLQVVSPGA